MYLHFAFCFWHLGSRSAKQHNAIEMGFPVLGHTAIIVVPPIPQCGSAASTLPSSRVFYGAPQWGFSHPSSKWTVRTHTKGIRVNQQISAFGVSWNSKSQIQTDVFVCAWHKCWAHKHFLKTGGHRWVKIPRPPPNQATSPGETGQFVQNPSFLFKKMVGWHSSKESLQACPCSLKRFVGEARLQCIVAQAFERWSQQLCEIPEQRREHCFWAKHCCSKTVFGTFLRSDDSLFSRENVRKGRKYLFLLTSRRPKFIVVVDDNNEVRIVAKSKDNLKFFEPQRRFLLCISLRCVLVSLQVAPHRESNASLNFEGRLEGLSHDFKRWTWRGTGSFPQSVRFPSILANVKAVNKSSGHRTLRLPLSVFLSLKEEHFPKTGHEKICQLSTFLVTKCLFAH